ncbi:MAG: histidine kinase, partial [Gemmatimonadaceae bacterium]
MPDATTMISRRIELLAAFAVWTVLGLLGAAQTALWLTHRGIPVEWVPLLLDRLADWYTCGVFTPLFFWLVRRLPFDGARWRGALPIYLAVTAGAVVLKYAMFIPLRRPILPEMGATFRTALAGNFIYELIIFWAIVGVIHAVEFFRRMRDRERHALALEAQLSKAQLEVLRGQLQPHFLFNTLNSIASLIHTAPARADAVVVQLADLLRASLDPGG